MEQKSTERTPKTEAAQAVKTAQTPKQAAKRKPEQAPKQPKPKSAQASKTGQVSKTGAARTPKQVATRKSEQTPKQATKRQPAHKPKQPSNPKPNQTSPLFAKYKYDKAADEARQQAEEARLIKMFQDIHNSSSASEPIDLTPEKEDLGPYKRLIFRFVCGLTACFSLIWCIAYCMMVWQDSKREPVEIKCHYKNYDPNRPISDIAEWDNENWTVYYPEDLGRPADNTPLTAPADTITVSYQDYMLYQARKNRYGVELDLGHGVSIQTGLDETEILDQIATESDIYSLTDYFDEYVGD